MKKKKLLNFRQGDVIILATEDPIPSGFRRKKDNVIIEGEVTGHLHEAKNGKLFTDSKDSRWMILEAEEGCVIIHPEHKPIKVPKGRYRIRIQREYRDGDVWKVKD